GPGTDIGGRGAQVPSSDGRLLGRLAARIDLCGQVRRATAPIGVNAEADAVSANRRLCRGSHDVAAREPWWLIELGLSLHLDPRHVRPGQRAPPAGLRGGGGWLLAMGPNGS